MTREEILAVAKPILFNTDMVRAILEGRKSVTRRVMKPQPVLDRKIFIGSYWKWYDSVWVDGTTHYSLNPERKSYNKMKYKPGDYLYIRETWSEWTDGYVYKAWTEPFPQPGRYPDKVMKWHPSIHMPKDAARIFPRVTGAR